jgi:hypothetical protein
MEKTYRIKLIMLARHLDNMPQNDLVASTIIMGYKGHDGTSHETFYPEYASAIPLDEIFPEEWTRNKNEMIVLRKEPNMPSCGSYMAYFNIDLWQFFHCFVGYFQDIEKYGGAIISHERVTPHMIALNIHGLIDRM